MTDEDHDRDHQGLQCPLPGPASSSVLLAHGGGGRLMHELIETVFYRAFDNPALAVQHDGAVLESPGSRLAFTTDSYVVRPLFFPGGDIGMLAVNGTVNDLAMCGARPLWLAAGFILEEGLEIATLQRVVDSMRRAAATAGVHIVTGDTKVVDRGKADGLYVTTAGIGRVDREVDLQPARVQAGDAVLLSGDIGRHGIAILAVREGLEFETTIESDCAPLAAPALALLESGARVHCLRDLTRGGLAAALVEIAATARVGIGLEEEAIPVREEVRAACEILGLDPLHVANEGRFMACVAAADSDAALAALHAHPVCHGARRIGTVTSVDPGTVVLRTAIGAECIIDMPSGEQLPRIC